MFWLSLNCACVAPRLSLFPTLSPSPKWVGRLGVGKKLGRDTTQTVDPNWFKGYSMLCNDMLSNRNEGKEGDFCFVFYGSLCSELFGHQYAYGRWWVISIALLMFFFSFLHLLICLVLTHNFFGVFSSHSLSYPASGGSGWCLAALD